jgi:uncharacterized membrane protein (GlpM family)
LYLTAAVLHHRYCINQSQIQNKNLLTLLAFVIATIILYLVYQYACYFQRADLLDYMQSNLLSVSSYTYVP